jgi:hypothetical protein
LKALQGHQGENSTVQYEYHSCAVALNWRSSASWLPRTGHWQAGPFTWANELVSNHALTLVHTFYSFSFLFLLPSPDLTYRFLFLSQRQSHTTASEELSIKTSHSMNASTYTKDHSGACTMHSGCRMTCYRTAIYSGRKTVERSLLVRTLPAAFSIMTRSHRLCPNALSSPQVRQCNGTVLYLTVAFLISSQCAIGTLAFSPFIFLSASSAWAPA